MDHAPPFTMGVTNQLISYAEAAFLAAVSRRVLVLPRNTAPLVQDLLDVEASAARLGVSILPFDVYSQRHPELLASSKRTQRLKLPSRRALLSGPASYRDAATKLRRDIGHLHAADVVRVGNVFWHVPFATSEVEHHSPAMLLSGLVFSQAVQKRADSVLRSHLAGQKISIVFHPRFEPDIAGFGQRFVPPTPARVASFLRKCVMPQLVALRKNAALQSKVVYVAAGGSLQASLIEAIVEVFEHENEFVVYHKDGRLSMRSKEAAVVPQSKTAAVTNHVDAAVDAAVIVHAQPRVVIGSDYSTFTRAIFIRRCVEMSHQQKAPLLFLTYDHELRYADWNHTCAEVLDSLYATTPHAYVPGFSRTVNCAN
jgi:hypothetical protein